METRLSRVKMRRVNGDVLTPISIYLRLQGTKKFLLESSLKHSDQGRYSFIGANPVFEVAGKGRETSIRSEHGEKTEKELPLAVVQSLVPKIEESLPFPFFGGAVGYVGYDAIRAYADIGQELEDALDVPDVQFMVFEDVVVFDHLEQAVYVVAIDMDGKAAESELDRRIGTLEKQLENRELDETLDICPIDFRPRMEKGEFIRRIDKAKEHVLKGEIEQIVLSQRMEGEVKNDPFHFYRVLRNSNPSPYMFYLDFGGYTVLGASPESFIQTTGGQVMTNPIAGTRPRGKDQEEDARLAAGLLADPKELSEHHMLVDLSCRDFEKFCEPESIYVKKDKKIEYYRHVMHIVSEVEGRLLPGKTGLDALISCLPAGTVSGSPRLDAMRLINRLEDVRRNVYAGAIGYMSANGDIDFALAIRSLVIKDGKAYLQAGAGIVADSDPESEYMETIHKARALLKL